MLNLQKYRNKNIAIYGMGITGFSAAKAFNNLNAKVYCWDDNQKVRKKIQKLKFKIDKFWLKKNSIDKIVISPGIDIENCKLKDYLKIFSCQSTRQMDHLVWTLRQILKMKLRLPQENLQ